MWQRTALLWLNYPHNPTGCRRCRRETLDEVAALARASRLLGRLRRGVRRHLLRRRRPRRCSRAGVDNVLAFHTLSKRSAMTGYRSGFMAGDPRLIARCDRFRPNVGVATPEFVQRAAIAAWNDDAHAADQRARYAAKRALFAGAFARRGWTVEASDATFYLWMQVPGGDDWASGRIADARRAWSRRRARSWARAARATCAGRWCRRSSSATRR